MEKNKRTHRKRKAELGGGGGAGLQVKMEITERDKYNASRVNLEH